MALFSKNKYLLAAKDRWKIVKSLHPILPWIMIKLKYMGLELELNPYKKFKKFLKLRKWKWKKKSKELPRIIQQYILIGNWSTIILNSY